MTLVETLWGKVTEAVEASPQGRKGVQRALASMQRGRNKNTYTRWLSPKSSDARPDIRISDLQDLAAALNVEAACLLDGGPPRPTRQLELPFEPGSRAVSIRMECAAKGVILRPAAD